MVLGTGGSLFRSLLGDDVFDIVARGKVAIGIFGTQYRELIPRASLERLNERLDGWFARYQDDVLMYGRGRDHVMHLGDWLIDLIPLAAATDDEPLRIGEGRHCQQTPSKPSSATSRSMPIRRRACSAHSLRPSWPPTANERRQRCPA